jgi:hypothetical protein
MGIIVASIIGLTFVIIRFIGIGLSSILKHQAIKMARLSARVDAIADTDFGLNGTEFRKPEDREQNFFYVEIVSLSLVLLLCLYEIFVGLGLSS